MPNLMAAVAAASEAEADLVIGFGGGSAMDLAKLVAVMAGRNVSLAEISGPNRAPPRQAALAQIPTTAGTGSEVGTRALVTDPDSLAKIATESRHMLADIAIVDPQLTHSVPPHVTAATGVDAMAHCVEALTSKRAHPVIDAYALQGIELVGKYLARAVADGSDAEARAGMALAALYGGVCLGPVNTTAGHAVSYPLGTRYKIAHGLANALIFPHALAANAPAEPAKTAAVGEPPAPSGETVEMTFREAARDGLRAALAADDRVFLMGEDVGAYGGCYAVSQGLMAEFGPERIRDTPLSESGFTGAGIGAAVAGMRPVVELMTVNFSLLALDQILNTAATLRHMSGGQFGVPLVIRMATGAGKQLAAQHSHSLEGWYAHIPGLKVLAPATLEDARGMLASALADPDPVLIFENVMLYNRSGRIDRAAGPVDIARAAIRRPGRDMTLLTYGGSLHKTLEAAAALEAEGLSAEVIDLRVLRPLDDATVMASVARTRRALIVDEGWRSGSLSAEISARIMEQAFWSLDMPVARVCAAEVPIPYARHLEEAAIPQVPQIVAAARALAGKG
ncbi:pyruvate dehydrogenase complex E1 component subunit beta [Mangrovicoccus ximenensis]|uniref:pyruvate dehydrogenase complex E1 component subunit beta n=1 Tax=Mangrovicoccus ximenensis TaxID=1911570 RepID=UPI001F006CC5